MTRTSVRPLASAKAATRPAPTPGAKRSRTRKTGIDLIYPADLGIYRMPGHLIRRLHQVSVSLFMEEMETAKIDLTQVQYAALTAIQRYPRIDQATLGGVIAYDRATIGGVIDRLEEKGLVRRTVDQENRRVRKLVMEPKGEKLLVRIRPLVARVQTRILGPLSESERTSFMRCMSKLTDVHNETSRAPLRPVRVRSE